MNSTEKKVKKTPPPAQLYLIESKIVVSLDEHSFLLNDGRAARQALSCLIRPEVGDYVLAATCQDDKPYILHVLQRSSSQFAQLSVPGVKELKISQEHLSLNAEKNIEINAMGDVDINATAGTLKVFSRNLFNSVSESLVQTTRHFIGQAEHYLLDVKQLLKLHGEQTIITAEQDIKVDAERISMG